MKDGGARARTWQRRAEKCPPLSIRSPAASAVFPRLYRLSPDLLTTHDSRLTRPHSHRRPAAIDQHGLTGDHVGGSGGEEDDGGGDILGLGELAQRDAVHYILPELGVLEHRAGQRRLDK